MIDRFGKEIHFSELYMEETLSAKDRKELDDSMYGIVYTDENGKKVRKYPLNDEKHVLQAVRFFNKAEEKYKPELARKIVKRAKELDMDYSGWDVLKPYLDKPVKESDDKRVNDKGETVPEKCDKCGSPIKVFLRGEPVYLCCNKDCRKYFGTVPCDIQEQYMTYEWLMKQNYPDPDSTSGTSDFDEHDDDPDDCFTESFEEMFGPVIQEAFDAVTGEEIPIDKAYSLEEMKERTYTEEELKKSRREIKDYLKFANDIAKRIKAQVEKDSKEPTGNQNCLLCTWCAEIGFRGVNKNPRPVYSPCDPIFKVHGENIVRDPMKIIPRGYDNLLEHLADVSQPFARFYVHVNWKGSRGGHEFLLLKVVDAEYYIVDAQAGKVDKLSDTHKYFTDINWENSYLCRLDNKNFNRKLFDTMNDPKMTLPWDPKRDIPYMLREGLITKDEAETELKRAETNEFYKVLKEKLGQTPVQESALPDGVFLRPATLKDVPTMRDWQLESINARLRKRPDMIEYMEKDARESVPDTKMIMSGDRTIGMLQCCWIDDGEWWYIGEIYLIAEFRGRGIGSTLLLNEIREHDKLRLQVATDNLRAKALYESLGFKTVKMNQDMEVMDLVKTSESVCENMVEQLKSFKYGLGSNGSVHSASSKEYDEKYRLESPEEFEENGGGICYDYVEFMDQYLKEYGYHCRKFYISTDTEDNDTHTFMLVNDGKGGYVYPESAFKLLEGVHHVKSPEDAALKVMDKVFDINDNGKKYDEIKYYVWEYEGHPPYGSTMKECGKYFTKGEPFHEGTAMKIKRKD